MTATHPPKRLSFLVRLGLLGGIVAAAHPAWATADPPARAALSLGSPIPAAAAKVKMKNVDGRQLSIRDVAGKKGTLVVFTCNHCPYAKAWEKRIATLADSFAKQGIGAILVNPNDPTSYPDDGITEMQARAKALGLATPYVVDETSDVARAFGATVTPEAFLFAADGKLVYHGTIDDNRAAPEKVTAHYLRDALTAVAAGRAPPTKETKSLGCSIKFRTAATK